MRELSRFPKSRPQSLQFEQLEQREVLSATGFTGDYALDNWTADSIPHGTTTISPASGESSEATFSFAPTLPPASSDRLLVDFLTTAAATGTVTFDYEYAISDSASFSAVSFDAVSGDGATSVVGLGLASNFTFQGSASFISQEGRDLGFRIGDANDDHNGDLRITNIVFHDELIEPIVVDSAADGDDGDLSAGNLTLREAVRLANEADGADTIVFDSSLAGSTITLTEGELSITSSMTINGLGADQLTVSGGGVSRVFAENGNGPRIIAITDLTIADGLANNGGAFFSNGGDVTFDRVVMTGNNSLGNNGSTLVMAFGTLEILNSAIVDNLNTGVGALRLQDTVTTITNSTISGNGTRGISFFNSNATADSLTLSNVTIADNDNAGIEVVAFNGATELTYQNTIFAGNGGRGGIDARGNEAGLPLLSIISLGHNLLDDTPTGDAAHDAATGDLRNTNPRLGPLSDNGGPTPTHALNANSPAIDAGDPAFAAPLQFDQRGIGFGRVQGGRIDIGAFEVQVSSPDFDDDGDVDGADFLAWQRGAGVIAGALQTDGDANGDGAVDANDLADWQANYGTNDEDEAAKKAISALAEFAPATSAPTSSAELLDAAMALSMDQTTINPDDLLAERTIPLELVEFTLADETSLLPSTSADESGFESAQIAAAQSSDPTWLSEELLEQVFGEELS